MGLFKFYKLVETSLNEGQVFIINSKFWYHYFRLGAEENNLLPRIDCRLKIVCDWVGVPILLLSTLSRHRRWPFKATYLLFLEVQAWLAPLEINMTVSWEFEPFYTKTYLNTTVEHIPKDTQS